MLAEVMTCVAECQILLYDVSAMHLEQLTTVKVIVWIVVACISAQDQRQRLSFLAKH